MNAFLLKLQSLEARESSLDVELSASSSSLTVCISTSSLGGC